MFPTLIHIGDLFISTYPLLYGLGLATAGLIVLILGHHSQGLELRRLAHLIMLVSAAVIVGGRLFYIVGQGPAEDYRDSSILTLTEGGHVLYGGLLLAILILRLGCRVLRLPAGTVSDLVAVGAPLGLAVGRLGCLGFGCCFGETTALPWGIEFPRHIDSMGNTVGAPALLAHIEKGLLDNSAETSLPVHPSQAYASLTSLLVFGLVLQLWLRRCFQGQLLLFYLFLYALCRFFLEFTRASDIVCWGLTIAQVISVPISLVSSTLFVWRRCHRRAN